MSDEELQQCIFCAVSGSDTELISIATNSLCIDNKIYEFSDLIRKLLQCRVNIFILASICDSC